MPILNSKTVSGILVSVVISLMSISVLVGLVNIGNLKTPLLKLYPLSNKLSRVHPKLTYLLEDAVLGLGTYISIIKLDEGCG